MCCKCCQYCLESLWWDCCEERFCWDDTIVLYEEDTWNDKNGMMGIDNGGASLESLVVTRQPGHVQNNNNLYVESNRDVLQELPILAPNLYHVFAKSMIFRDDSKDPGHFDDDELLARRGGRDVKKTAKETSGKVVKFSDETEKDDDEADHIEDKHITDFQIMFQDELYGKDHKIFKIEEEDEEDNIIYPQIDKVFDLNTMTDSADDFTPRKDSKTPTPIDINIQHPTPEKANDSSYNSTPVSEEGTVVRKKLPKSKSAHHLLRSDSNRSFVRNNSRQDLLRRVESFKENETENIKNVLARLPERTASFIKIPNLIDGNELQQDKKDNVFTISGNEEMGKPSLLSQMPDTPIIKGYKLPKFFAETPTIGEYKPEFTLQQSVKTSEVNVDFDYSMPKYFQKYIPKPTPLHASNSMPDLNAAASGKVNKRLVKLRSKLKPLVIKKNDPSSSKTFNEAEKF